MFYIYLLLRDDLAVYVGCTQDMNQRMSNHRSKRTEGFTTWRVLEEVDANLDTAHAVERAYQELYKVARGTPNSRSRNLKRLRMYLIEGHGSLELQDWYIRTMRKGRMRRWDDYRRT